MTYFFGFKGVFAEGLIEKKYYVFLSLKTGFHLGYSERRAVKGKGLRRANEEKKAK